MHSYMIKRYMVSNQNYNIFDVKHAVMAKVALRRKLNWSLMRVCFLGQVSMNVLRWLFI